MLIKWYLTYATRFCYQDDKGGDYRYSAQPDMDKSDKDKGKKGKKSKKERNEELEGLKKELEIVSNEMCTILCIKRE